VPPRNHACGSSGEPERPAAGEQRAASRESFH
jgi:hypothetical protein